MGAEQGAKGACTAERGAERSGALQRVMRHHFAHGTGGGERPSPVGRATRGWLSLPHSLAHSSSPFGGAASSGGAGHTREILPCLARGCDLVNPILRGGSGAAHGPLHAGGGHHGVADRWGVGQYNPQHVVRHRGSASHVRAQAASLGTWRLLTIMCKACCSSSASALYSGAT